MRRALLFLSLFGLTGCRTAGPQIALRDCANCTVHVAGEMSASQGKSLPVDVLNNPTLSASQNGNANATRREAE